jgi:hypothetical protein
VKLLSFLTPPTHCLLLPAPKLCILLFQAPT